MWKLDKFKARRFISNSEYCKKVEIWEKLWRKYED